MQIQPILVAIFLNWVAFDLNLFRRREGIFSTETTSMTLSLEAEELKQKEQLQHHRMDVVPPHMRGLRKPVQCSCNYFSTKPRDVRFSNQRKIRRMFNNM
jgi:hypothetical protein